MSRTAWWPISATSASAPAWRLNCAMRSCRARARSKPARTSAWRRNACLPAATITSWPSPPARTRVEGLQRLRPSWVSPSRASAASARASRGWCRCTMRPERSCRSQAKVLITLAPNAILRPTAGFMLAHPARFIALGFGTGLSPFAPGTVGTPLGFPVYWILSNLLARYGPLGLLAFIAAMFLLGVWACARTGRDLGIADHSGMNWDEIVAFQLVLLLAPQAWQWQAFAFF